jgi:hypothetical protein
VEAQRAREVEVQRAREAEAQRAKRALEAVEEQHRLADQRMRGEPDLELQRVRRAALERQRLKEAAARRQWEEEAQRRREAPRRRVTGTQVPATLPWKIFPDPTGDSGCPPGARLGAAPTAWPVRSAAASDRAPPRSPPGTGSARREAGYSSSSRPSTSSPVIHDPDTLMSAHAAWESHVDSLCASCLDPLSELTRYAVHNLLMT